jgi:glycosyltransferase involved in cell wall biosynthesis
LKILILTRYTRLGASSRLRFLQYLPYLENSGISTTISPLFTDRYILNLQDGKKNYLEIIISYFKRFIVLIKSREFNVFWIEKELFPYIPFWIEKCVLINSKVNYILDFDDAVFHNYDLHNSLLVRFFLRNKHKYLINNASKVIVGNEYLAEYAKRALAKFIAIIPTVVDINRYGLEVSKNNTANKKIIHVGWIGQNSSALNLIKLNSIFKKLTSEGKFKFIAVGIDTKKYNLCMDSVTWSEKDEVETLKTFDIGIMPLNDGYFEKGKCGYKLIQFMACAIPVVASPIGINKNLILNDINGYLAYSDFEWENYLNRLADDYDLRVKLGGNGRIIVEQSYCLDVTAKKLIDFLCT